MILDSPPLSPILSSSFSSSTIRRREHHTSDVIIVGAGILGCALAITLARQGRSVTLLEKSLKEPDRIVGELLQPGGVQALEKLGIRECLEGIDAVVVKGYEVIYYGDGVEIPYPKRTTGIMKGTSPEGRSFHHGRFIGRLRETAMKEDNISVIESTVTGTIKSGYSGQVLGVECTTKTQPDVYFADLTVIADGYASKFRKDYLPHAPTSRSKFWGLELIDADLPRTLHGHVVLGEGAPVLLYQIGSHETRALVDIPDGLHSASTARGGVKSHLREVVLPSLPPSVRPSFERALDEGRLRSMPNSFLPASTNRVAGLVVLGDAMNMRHPLTGGGMTVAFNDVVLLRELLSPETIPDLGNTKLVLQKMRVFHWRRKRLTAVINVLAQALYDLFAADGKFAPRCVHQFSSFLSRLFNLPLTDPQLKKLQHGCFRYFQLGGACIDGPIGLLAGIIRRPFVLFYHFFSVALLAIWILLGQSTWFGMPGAILESVTVFSKACHVLLPVVWSEVWA